MKAYSLDLRRRIVAYVQNGGGKTEAARRFGVGRDTVYRYLDADAANTLAPKTTWGHWRKLDPQRLAQHVQAHADDTLVEIGKMRFRPFARPVNYFAPFELMLNRTTILMFV
jgi:transposase